MKSMNSVSVARHCFFSDLSSLQVFFEHVWHKRRCKRTQLRYVRGIYVHYSRCRPSITGDSGGEWSGFGSNLEEPFSQNVFLYSARWTSHHRLLHRGLITQPLYITNELISLLEPNKDYSMTFEIVFLCFQYFGNLSILTVTVMSIERWLHMARQSLVNVHRTRVILAVLLLLPIPLAVQSCTVLHRLFHIKTSCQFFSFPCLFWCHIDSLLQSFPYYSSSSAANSLLRIARKFCHTSY